MSSMHAALLHGPKDLRVSQVPQPDQKNGEVLLRVRAVGVCGSDLHYYHEGGIGSAVITNPFIPGHEFAAEVVNDPGGEFTPGTLVAVDPARPCGHCEWCHRGHPNLCPHVKFAGAPPYPGALSEYVSAPRQALYPVPKSFDATITALLEPLGVAIHALDLAKLKAAESVAVLGAGPIGLLLMQMARACGAGDIFVIDPLQYRAAIARDLGASDVAQSHQAIDAWTGGRGVDVVLEATDSPLGPQHAAETVAIGGRVILVGIPEGDQFNLEASLVRRKGLTIKLSRRMGDVYPRAIQLTAKGRIELGPIATHTFPLTKSAEAFALQASHQDGVIKTVIEP